MGGTPTPPSSHYTPVVGEGEWEGLPLHLPWVNLFIYSNTFITKFATLGFFTFKLSLLSMTISPFRLLVYSDERFNSIADSHSSFERIIVGAASFPGLFTIELQSPRNEVVF